MNERNESAIMISLIFKSRRSYLAILTVRLLGYSTPNTHYSILCLFDILLLCLLVCLFTILLFVFVVFLCFVSLLVVACLNVFFV